MAGSTPGAKRLGGGNEAEKITGANYGFLHALAEKALLKRLKISK